MDYTTEVVNITKIKDGFFLGDEATASNLDVIIQFKITHMVNAAGSQIINAWESIGIKYLTLNWSEHSNQNLFDQKDEIATRIVNFIDDSTKSGEGLLVHSLRGQNRGCIVVLIYLIKKYRWTLAKALEFLTSKKFDVEIPKYFLNQLSFFESRLSKLGVGPKSNSWQDNGNDNDPDELVIRNTYLNGLSQKEKSQSDSRIKGFNYNSRRICWADDNKMNKSLLCSINMGKELVYQKDIKPVLSHKKLKPIKSCLKTRSQSTEIKKSPSGILSGKISESLIGEKKDSSKNVNNIQGIGGEISIGGRSASIDNVRESKYGSGNNTSPYVKYQDNSGGNTLNSNTNNNLRSSSNELLKNYTNLYSSMNVGDNLVTNNLGSSINMNNMTNSYNLSKSVNMENNSSKQRERENTNMPSISHLNIGGGSNTGNNNVQSSQGTRQNNFTMNNSAQQRSYSVGNDPNKTGGSNTTNNNSQNSQSNQIIIASKYKNVVHNSYNNIFIQSPTGLDMINNNNYDSVKNDKLMPGMSINSNTNPYMSNNISSSKINPMSSSINVPQSSYAPSNIQMQSQGKLTKSGENQRIPQNNYFMGNSSGVNSSGNISSSINSNIVDYKNLKVIDYTAPNSKPGTPGYISTGNSQIQNYQSYGGYIGTNNKGSVNNYQPELNKKNNFNSNQSSGTGLLNRPNSQIKGPIKIQNEYDKKPSTPDNIYHNNYSTVKLGSSTKISNPQSQSNYGTIKRSNSKSKNDGNNPSDRPSTAPQKENDKQGYGSQGMKRLPSPNLKSGGSTLGSSQKNMNTGSSNLGQSVNMARYRSPSPSTLNKSSTITLGSMKAGSSKAPKWK